MADLLQSEICEILQAMQEPCLDTGQSRRVKPRGWNSMGTPGRQRRNGAAVSHKKPGMLLLTLDVCRKIGRFVACQIHVRHARMRRQKKICKRPLVEVGLVGDGRERWSLCRTPLLV